MVSISLCLLNRNGGWFLEDCLKSAAEIVEEIIVVDSGSEDESLDIASAFGARILSFPWQDDFSLARNRYLEAAACDWILVLDSDEVLGNAPALRSLADSGVGAAFRFPLHHYFFYRVRDGGKQMYETVSHSIRLFPRLPSIRYHFPVHETVYFSLKHLGLPVRNVDIPVHHFGFLLKPEIREEKISYYQKLGEKKLREFPEVPQGYLELAGIYRIQGKRRRAQKMERECRKRFPLFSASPLPCHPLDYKDLCDISLSEPKASG